jgi:predicted histidine transporter YuiF (NhaC family)
MYIPYCMIVIGFVIGGFLYRKRNRRYTNNNKYNNNNDNNKYNNNDNDENIDYSYTELTDMSV